jgi:hypothetical protein
VDSTPIAPACADSVHADFGAVNQIVCAECKSVVGESSPFEESTIKVWKYAVALLTADGTRVEASFEACMVYELHQSFRAHAHCKFIFRDSHTDSVLGLIWILNWDAWISVDVGSELHHAVKTLYLPSDDSAFESCVLL